MKKNIIKNKIWQEFIKWGMGWKIEAERDYKQKGNPLIYHLFMYGYYYADDYELVGENLTDLLEIAIRDGKKAGDKCFNFINRTIEKYEKKEVIIFPRDFTGIS